MSRSPIAAPAEGGFAITPHDNEDLPAVTRAIYVGTSSSKDLKVIMADGTTLVFHNIAAGIHPLQIKRVLASGTSATDLVGLI